MAMSEFRHMTTSLNSMWFHLDSHLRLSHLKVCGLDWQSVDFKSQVEKIYERSCA